MRRALLALALLPSTLLAQSLTLSSSPLQQAQLTNGVRAQGYGAGYTAGYTADPTLGADGIQSAAQIRANTDAANARDKNRKDANDQAAGYSAGTAQTAAEQGLTKDTSKQDAQARADFLAAHTPRQLGQVVSQPAPFRAVATDRSAAGWLANWAYTLHGAGIPDGKVAFEAQRLDRDAFAAWANRQLMVTDMASRDTATPDPSSSQ